VAAEPSDASAHLRQLPPFELIDTRGTLHSLAGLRTAKATVLFFLGHECPVSNGYSPEMQRIAAKYADRGIAIWGIHCDPEVTMAAASEHAKQYGLTFPIMLDPEQRLAAASGVRVTPEAVLVSSQGKLLYHGRIDDRYAPQGKRRDEPRVRDLDDAISAVLAGNVPRVAETKAFGCPLPPLK
jgi:peroxiredoxin